MSDLNQAALDMPEHQHPAAAQHPMESLDAPPNQNHGKLSEDQKNALDIHNRARNEADKSSGHARGDLAWDDKLAAHATAYARHLASANQGLKHSDGKNRPGEGENLYWSKPNGSMAGASRGWVGEKKNYHGEKIGQGDFGSYGHYTQDGR
ncbi:MAG: hypothetical protein LQ345_002507 [Seirophora villosa]|nr:MAG: hypothetical protein LQ345_002507 [Seirophora villosa]